MYCISDLCLLFFVYGTEVDVFCSKQKTAYELRISDWSSDVCSSDLRNMLRLPGGGLIWPLLASQNYRDAAPVRQAQIAQVAPDQIGRVSCRARVCQDV